MGMEEVTCSTEFSCPFSDTHLDEILLRTN